MARWHVSSKSSRAYIRVFAAHLRDALYHRCRCGLLLRGHFQATIRFMRWSLLLVSLSRLWRWLNTALVVSGPATAAANLARRHNCCRPVPPQLLPLHANSSTSSTSTTTNTTAANRAASRDDAAVGVPRWEPCASGRMAGSSSVRHRWGGQASALSTLPAPHTSPPPLAQAVTKASRRGAGAGAVVAAGAGAAAVQGRHSSFLADAVRETAANHCIDRVVNGTSPGAVTVVSCELATASSRSSSFSSRLRVWVFNCPVFKGR